MKTEEAIREMLKECRESCGIHVSKKICPMLRTEQARGLCMHCSLQQTLEWVLEEKKSKSPLDMFLDITSP